jgi:Predicted amidophosphoribosyltransferases
MYLAEKLEALRPLASLFYPPACAVCARPVGKTEYLCGPCQKKAQRIIPPFCAKCSEPFAGAISGSFTCGNCAHRKLQFDAAVSAYRSRGVVRFLILQFKYNRQLHLRHPIGRWLMEAMADPRLQQKGFDLIVPVPLHPARVRERGFNQAELLARMLAEELRIPLSSALQRVRYTTTQTAFDRTDRMENLRNAFRLRRKGSMRELRVLLVDDILTTGSTLSECARVLREAGAHSVYAVTAARA